MKYGVIMRSATLSKTKFKSIIEEYIANGYTLSAYYIGNTTGYAKFSNGDDLYFYPTDFIPDLAIDVCFVDTQIDKSIVQQYIKPIAKKIVEVGER